MTQPEAHHLPNGPDPGPERAGAPGAAAVAPAAGGSGQRRHTHPLTPVVNAVRTVGVLVGAMLVFGSEPLREAASAVGGLAGLLVLLAGLVVLVALVLAGHYWTWLRTEFFFDDDGDFRLDSGILQRNERRVALSRVQSVDVVRPLLGRVVGLGQVRLEVAGGGDSRILVSYLTDTEAQALRAEILARAAGVDPGAGEAPERILATVPATDLALSLVMRSETVMLFLASVIVVVGVVGTEGLEGLPLFLLTGGLPLLTVFSQFVRFFGFTVAESPDGLRLRHGLTSVESQTVPPGRVQAVEIAEPLLWRRKGWVRVRLNVAGVRTGEDDAKAEQVLLPVAPRDVAAGIIGRVLPGVDLASLQFSPAPRQARWRAWLQWSNLGVAVDPAVLATRRGFLTRFLAVIPHARTQSVRVTQGPWQRRLGLATVHVDSTPGPVVLVGLHRDVAEARQIAEAQLVRAAHARAVGPAPRWMSHLHPGAPSAGAQPTDQSASASPSDPLSGSSPGFAVGPNPVSAPGPDQQPARGTSPDPALGASPDPALGASPDPAPGASPDPAPGSGSEPPQSTTPEPPPGGLPPGDAT